MWGVDLAAIYVAWAFGCWAGLVAGYLAAVNSLLHLGPALARREYNPGLVTAVVLLLPLGTSCVLLAGAGLGPHLMGLLLALGVHAVVVIHVARRLATLGAGAKSTRGQGATLVAVSGR